MQLHCGCSWFVQVEGEAHVLWPSTAGMAGLNVERCDFVIYSSFDDSMCVVTVPLNRDFCLTMLHHLKGIYFKCVLPILCYPEEEPVEY